MRFEARMLSFALFAGFPAVLVATLLLWLGTTPVLRVGR